MVEITEHEGSKFAILLTALKDIRRICDVAIQQVEQTLDEEYIETPESSNIGSIHYYYEQKFLDVQFRGTDLYRYFDVPEDVWRAFKEAESKGKFLNKQIKGIYEFQKAV